MTPLWIVTCTLRKPIPGGETRNVFQGYRVCATKDEAVGSVLAAAMEAKPGFDIEQFIAMEIPPGALRNALGLLEPDQAEQQPA